MMQQSKSARLMLWLGAVTLTLLAIISHGCSGATRSTTPASVLAPMPCPDRPAPIDLKYTTDPTKNTVTVDGDTWRALFAGWVRWKNRDRIASIAGCAEQTK